MFRNFAHGSLVRLAVLAAFFTIAAVSTARAADSSSPREHLLLDFNWRFQLGDSPDVGTTLDYPEIKDLGKIHKADVDAESKLAATRPSPTATHLGESLSFVKSDFDDTGWRQLNLPHDWAVELPFNEKANYQHGFKDLDPAKGTTIGWYRRTFTLPASDKGRTLTVEFDGVYRNSLVWFNGHILGRHPSGYTSFEYDITKYANCGEGDAGKNTLVVRADASRVEGWFYEGAGIYRHVWLTKRDPIHVARWGTYIHTALNDERAEIRVAQISIETGLRNNNDPVDGVSLTSTILDADGKSIAELTTGNISLDTNKTNTIKQNIGILEPHLWSPDMPYMYKLVSTVKKADGTLADTYETPFGIRTIKFDPNQGLLLNGKRIELYGTCNHQDHAGVGSALPDRLQSFRIEKLKEFGSNAYRTSHNAPTPELLDACDRLGMLVMDENRRMGTDKESTSEFESLIMRDRNHPSVFIWSVGNEEFRDNMQADETDGVAICKAMQDVAHKLDPSRLCTVAMNGSWGLGFSNVIDVIGFNYVTRGTTKKGLSVDDYHAKFPDRPTIGTEDASTVCTRGIYADDKVKGYVSAYDIRGTSTAEKWWNFYAVRPFLPGSFVWTGFDYRGEPTPYKWPCINSHFGILDTCGFPKDNFYYYQSVWTAKPMVHIFPHWNWSGKEGQDINVWAYSNADEVELSLNGAVISRQKMSPREHLEWKVKYAPGTLLAKAYKDGQQVAEDKVETTADPASIQLAPDRPAINADHMDVSIITVSTRDAQNRQVPTADNEIAFTLTGPATIIGVGNGDPSSHEPDKATQRHLFNGLAQVILQSTGQPGEIQLTATSENLKTATLSIHAAPCTPPPSVP